MMSSRCAEAIVFREVCLQGASRRGACLDALIASTRRLQSQDHVKSMIASFYR